MEKVLQDKWTSKIVLNSETKTVTKHLKTKDFTDYDFELYKKVSANNPYFIQVKEHIDNVTYTMEYLPKVVGNVQSYFANNKFTKQEYIKLFNLVTGVWTSAMQVSAGLPEDQFYVHDDFKFENIAVCNSKDIGLSFKLLDCDCWHVMNGTESLDTFYYSLFKMSLLMQRLNHV